MNIALFANTGLGNEVLKSLLTTNINLKLVVTRKLEGKFPYYDEEDLDELSNRLGVEVVTDVNVNSAEFKKYLSSLNLDLIIVSSFHQIIKEEIINLPKKGIINFHPSLLPKYRGPNPLNWVLLNSEEFTGVTVHKLVKNIDGGDILLQKKYRILPFQSLGELFKELALLSGSMAKNVIELYESYNLKFLSQDESKMTYLKKPFALNNANEDTDVKVLINKLRAFVPFPGLNFNFKNMEYRITSYDLSKKADYESGNIIHDATKKIFLVQTDNNEVILKYN